MLLKTLTYSQICDFLIANEKDAKSLYLDRDFTAKQIAEHFKIVYNNNFQKACLRVLGEKGKGLGGARQGAGNFKEKERVQRKRDFEPITITLPKECIEILKAQKDTYSNVITRAILYYAKVSTRNIED
ncbi:hypothetical protein [Emticicia sp. BO119]|uniref:hypothetical protein n=1 Tax=Emticicia sp. BO119 TaxID=2757768 RepID=UPI0015F0EBC0|nr:hypothetical protein [Emticicia sp. BO119]MBA4852081.1 hypothetical protein [Emticicia sp. BO119]